MKSVFTFFFVFLQFFLFAQNPESELSGNGICFPQLSIADRNQLSPIPGQCIFNTDAECLECFIDQLQGWQSFNSLLTDRDRDTQVLVERSPDEDIIYLVGKGQNLLTVRASDYGDARVEPSAFGFDDSYRANIFFGAETGHEITSGTKNVIIGVESGVGLSTGSLNTTLGTRSGMSLTDGTSNTFLGSSSGQSHAEGTGNTFVGAQAGESMSAGSLNTNIGFRSDGPTNGAGNVFVGAYAGEEIHNASNNVYIGAASGSDADGNHNVFIGYQSGGNFNTNSKLVIESHPDGNETASEGSLIYGDFDEDYVTINHTLKVSRLLQLQALETEPVCDEEAFGSIYMNGFENKLKLCTSIGWKAIALEP